LELGDSVAVDGVCLTAEKIVSGGFVASVSPETLQRSTLEQASQSSAYVNIESSLRAGGKIGGHFVSGHVDGIGSLVKSVTTQNAWELTFSAPSGMMEQWQRYLSRFLVSKGSIAVNGISLTIADCDHQGSWFKVAVIPVTYGETNLNYLKIGDWVNLEGDILGKYVEKLLGDRYPSQARQEEISLAFLNENGYG
jgi:riboflavin synthase